MFFDLRSSQCLFEAAQKLGCTPRWVTKYGLLAVVLNGSEQYLFSSKSCLNTHLAATISANKHASRAIFAEHQLPNIPYLVTDKVAELEAFFDQYHSIISKPVLGQRAEDVTLVADKNQLPKLELEGRIFEQYIQGAEYRYLVLHDEVIAVHQKDFQGKLYTPEGSRRISFSEQEWVPNLVEVARKATQVIGLQFAAVDFIVTTDNFYLLEINSAPAVWRFESPDQGPAIPLAEMLLQAMLKDI